MTHHPDFGTPDLRLPLQAHEEARGILPELAHLLERNAESRAVRAIEGLDLDVTPWEKAHPNHAYLWIPVERNELENVVDAYISYT